MNRLKELRLENNLTMKDAAKRLGLPYTTYVNYEKGLREPNSEVLISAAKSYGVTVDYLIGNVSEPFFRIDNRRCIQDINSYNDLPSNILPYSQGRRIPVVGSIAAGMPILAEENIEGYDYADVPEEGEYFFLRVKGDSMVNANIFDGSLVLIKQQPCADNGQIVACVINGDEATLKRFYQKKDTVVLQPENPSFDPIIVSCKDFENGYAHILGVAIEVKTKL